MVKLAVLAIHGMGTKDRSSFDEFEIKLKRRLERMDISEGDYSYLGFKYADIFEERAGKVFDLVKGLDWMKVRHFVIHYLGDALAYQKGSSGSSRIDYYHEIHSRLESQISSWRNEIGNDVPLLIIAHSLGAYIISNYVWDRQKYDKLDNPFENMETVCSLITMGCNIPILTLGFDYDKLYPINIPGEHLEDKEEYKWLNYFDDDDPLSIPLSDFYSYETEDQERTISKIEDIEVKIGSFLTGWTPYSHAQYWKDSAMVDASAVQINHLLRTIG